MRSSLLLSAGAALTSHAVALPAGDGNQLWGKAVPSDEAEARAAAVKEVFQTAWDGYYQWVSINMHGLENKFGR